MSGLLYKSYASTFLVLPKHLYTCSASYIIRKAETAGGEKMEKQSIGNSIKNLSQYLIPGLAAVKLYRSLRNKGGSIPYSLGNAILCEAGRDILLGLTIYQYRNDPSSIQNPAWEAWTYLTLDGMFTFLAYGMMGGAAHANLEQKLKHKYLEGVENATTCITN